MLRSIRFLATASAIAICSATSVTSALTFSTIPSSDTFVSTKLPDNNYGGAGALEVSASGATNGGYESLLQFDLSGAKSSFDAGQSQITAVTLQLTATAPGNPIFNANAAGSFTLTWMQNDGWTEGNGNPGTASTTGGVTFNTLPSFLGASDTSLGNFNFVGGNSGIATYTLGLPNSFVSDILSGGSVSLLVTPNDSSVSYLSNSRSFGTTTARPLLTITATTAPEPSVVILVGGIMLLGRRRRLA
ncbi:MAG TPA: DNRLRE domain-containing protein [Tepidisphaeraceae bacterium]|jgi:hypothetical protein|nr:DNRLRE domain-containing protein [Tepidisphaeraceae bacterium]